MSNQDPFNDNTKSSFWRYSINFTFYPKLTSLTFVSAYDKLSIITCNHEIITFIKTPLIDLREVLNPNKKK